MYRFIKRNSISGRDFKYRVLAPDIVVRMFPKNLVVWQGMVHESSVGNLSVKTLSSFLKHYTYKDFSKYLNKMNSYSNIGEQNNKAKNEKVNLIKNIVFRPFFAFIKMYSLIKAKKGWLDFVLSANYANYTLNTVFKDNE